jgi:NAD(P)-dependent dehydrogenase (short-subunit alcohol dehydrogenase family)
MVTERRFAVRIDSAAMDATRPSRGERRGTVLVTGASSGIGEDAARYLNSLGYTVAAAIRKPADGERLVAAAAEPSRMRPVILDVTRPDQVAAARTEVEAIVAEGAPLVGLFSNAGIASYDGPLSCERCPIETQQRVMEVNHFGAVRVIQTFLPLVREARGTIVINSALMAQTVIPFNAGYGASKAALEAWADALRREVAPHGVRVAIIEAAAISTELETKQDPSAVPDDPLYPAQRPMAERSFRVMSRLRGRPALSPRRVSELVVEAIESPRPPRPRRIVGGGARPIRLLGALPDRVQDRVFGLALRGLARRG